MQTPQKGECSSRGSLFAFQMDRSTMVTGLQESLPEVTPSDLQLRRISMDVEQRSGPESVGATALAHLTTKTGATPSSYA